MKTRLLALPLLMLTLFAPSFPDDRAAGNVVIQRERIVDNAGVLDIKERMALKGIADSVSAARNFDIVIVTEKSIGGKSPRDFADDFFDKFGYGAGSGRDGSIFLQVTESRDMYFSTSGRGIKILNSPARQKLESDVVKLLKKGDNYAAYSAVIADWDKFLILAEKGKRYNSLNQSHISWTIASWIVAFVFALIIVSAWGSGMNTALQKTQAANYVVSGSLDFAVKKDSFLYSTTTKVKRETSASNVATAGGALAAAGKLGGHIASSGRMHGGGGRKY